MLNFFNSVTKQIEELKTIEKDTLKMYVCGPTVYDRVHIGNARSIVIFDTLFRLLKEIYREVIYCRNITDIDDKIIKRAKELETEELDLSQKMTDFFHLDSKFLNCLEPTFEPKVSDHIPEIINMIEKLIANGFGYEMEGNVFFSVEKYSDYGKLSRRNLEKDIENEDSAIQKKNPKDFALWKRTNEGLKWKSPWGLGRPGWHVECSAMSTKYLGETFDIHGGGSDLIFPHHENEIAQSKCCFQGSEYAKFWIHNGTLMLNGTKMSKSLGNFITVQECIDKKYHPAAVRFALLSSNYHNSLNFEEKLIKDYEILVKNIEKNLKSQDIKNVEKIQKILEILSSNLDTVSLIRNIVQWNKEGHNNKLLYALKVLGILELLNLEKSEEQVVEIPENIKQLAEKRFQFKKEKNFEEADKIRNELKKLKFDIYDFKNSYRILKLK